MAICCSSLHKFPLIFPQLLALLVACRLLYEHKGGYMIYKYAGVVDAAVGGHTSFQPEPLCFTYLTDASAPIASLHSSSSSVKVACIACNV